MSDILDILSMIYDQARRTPFEPYAKIIISTFAALSILLGCGYLPYTFSRRKKEIIAQ